MRPNNTVQLLIRIAMEFSVKDPNSEFFWAVASQSAGNNFGEIE